MRALVVLVCLLLGMQRVSADTAALLATLDTDDPQQLRAAIAAIETAPGEPGLADVLFAAGRACEDRLHDPVRALALYERILREMPDAGVAIAAARRAESLRDTKAHAREAQLLAELIATADTLPPADVERRATELATARWPGALEAELFLADWLCRTRRFAAAQARYAQFLATHADAPEASLARRNAAGCAIDANDWALAERFAAQLAGRGEVDEAIRVDLLSSIETGQRRAWLYRASWIGLVAGTLVLLLSLVEAIVRGGVRLPAWQPPVEVAFIAPVGAVVIAASFAIDRLIAPAVVQILVTGLAAAWLSGATLDLLRARGRRVALRTLLHVVACGVLVLSIGYIAMTRGELLELLSETVRFGPEA